MTLREKVQFDRTAKDYAKYRAGFPPALVMRLQPRGIGLPGQRILDLGTGTGTLARHFARNGCRVTGLDPAQALLDEARLLDQEVGVTVRYCNGKAEHTGFADASFDVVTAGQCWHWFDRAAVAQEVLRLLPRGGSIVIAHFDWLPLAGNVVSATEALIERYNPEWTMGGGTGLYPRWLSDLGEAGFIGLETFSFDVDVPYSHEAWLGRIRASAGIAASQPADRVEQFTREHAAMLRERFPEDPLRIPHRVWAVVGRKPFMSAARRPRACWPGACDAGRWP